MSKLMNIFSKPMMAVMSKLTPSCEVVSQRVSKSMDGKLTLKEKIGVKIHLLGCELCERYRQQLVVIQKMLQNYSTQMENKDISSDLMLRDEKKEKIIKLLLEED
jgi:hypothetical protein